MTESNQSKTPIISGYIPENILDCARRVEMWMAEQGHKQWELLGICDRNKVCQLETELADAKKWLDQLKDQRDKALAERDTAYLERNKLIEQLKQMKPSRIRIINKNSQYFGHIFNAYDYVIDSKSWRVWTGLSYMWFDKTECEVV